jgi:carbon monoxide dehydrogenase subunit G
LTSWIGIIHSVEELTYLESYTAVLEDRVGPVRLRADLDISATVVTPNACLEVRARGHDRAVDSKISIFAQVSISSIAEGVQLRALGDYQVTGRAAGMGAGLIHKKADRILDEFFGNVERQFS